MVIGWRKGSLEMSSVVPAPISLLNECESSSDDEISDDELSDSETISYPSNCSYECSDSWCVTNMDILKLDFVWIIKDFVRYIEVFENTLTSSTFSAVEDDDDTKWCLKLKSKGKGEETNDYVSVFLVLVSSSKEVVCARFSIAIVNKYNDKVNEKISESPCNFSLTQDWGFKHFISREVLHESAEEMLPGGHLTVKCEIQVNRGLYNVSGVSKKFNMPRMKLLEDFHNLIEQKKYTDVILKVGGHNFKAHKAVLAARSEHFAEMFKGHENEECAVIKIPDISREVFHETLLFLYTGNAPNIECLAKELIVVADRFKLERLKALSEEILFSQLTVENASDTLILANLYNGKQLQRHTLQFIKTNAAIVYKTPGWANLQRCYPHMIPDDIFPSEMRETARERRLRLRNQAKN